MSSTEFYDEYIDYQVQSGINDRIWNLYKRTLHEEIKNSAVLEIGCGIGALTLLLSGKLAKGTLDAIDLSPRSIEYAKKRVIKKNVSFWAGDVFDFKPSKAYDHILLFDVLEHIPKEMHNAVFHLISGWLNKNGKLLINIPSPYFLLHEQQYNPASLQEIDQPLFIVDLLPIVKDCGLELKYFEVHSIWNEEEYNFFILHKIQSFQKKKVQKNFLKKVESRVSRIKRKFFYPLPPPWV